MAKTLDPSDLEKAACSGDVKKVRKLLDVSNTDLSKSKGHPRDKNGSTALHLAVSENHVVAVRTLIRAGANINLPGSTPRMSPLMYGVYLDRVSCVCELLKLGADINWADDEGINALILAAQCGREKCLKHLIKAGADVDYQTPRNTSGGFNKGRTALMYAAHIHSINCLKRLLKAGADANVKTTDGSTALHFTARSEDMGSKNIGECLKVLLDSGADCNATTSNGETALMALTNSYGCHPREMTPNLKNEFLKCVKLLKKSANKIDDEGKTLLMQIVRKDCLLQALPQLPVLVKAGAVVNQQDFRGMTALAHASSMNSHAWARCLLDAGASVNICDLSGKSPLSYAAMSGGPESVRLLINLVSPANIRDCSGKTPLHYLVSSDNWNWNVEKCLKILRSKDLGVNDRDNDGMTPLMYVAKLHNRFNYMRILLEHGANINLVDNLGRTALFHYLQSFLDPLNSLAPSAPRLFESKLARCSKTAFKRGGKLTVGNLFRLTQINCDEDLLNLEVGDEVNLNKNVPWNNFVSVIYKKKRKILQFLIINKVMPPLPQFIIDKEKPIRSHLRSPPRRYPPPHPWDMPSELPADECAQSLLENGLMFGHIGITKYLIATCYLSSNDLKFCSGRYPNHCVESNNLEFVSLVESLQSQPWPLVKLCFVAVSTAFAASPGRQERIKNSQLPPKLQKMLLYQEPWSRLCVYQWDEIPLIFDSVKYENLPRPRPLLHHWPVGRALIPCDCGECDGTMYKYELDEEN